MKIALLGFALALTACENAAAERINACGAACLGRMARYTETIAPSAGSDIHTCECLDAPDAGAFATALPPEKP